MPGAGRLLIANRHLKPTDLANIRGAVQAGTTTIVKTKAKPKAGPAEFGLPLMKASSAKDNLKKRLEAVDNTYVADAVIAEFLQDIHDTLVESKVIPKNDESHLLCEYADFYDCCLVAIKAYMEARVATSILVPK